MSTNDYDHRPAVQAGPTNGRTPPTAEGMPLRDLSLPPVWGTPPGTDTTEPAGVDGYLTAGDETNQPASEGPVEGHLIKVSKPRRARLSAVGEPIRPAWMRDRTIARESATRGLRIAGRGVGIGALNTPRVVILGAWWTGVGAVLTGGRLLRWVLDIDGHPVVGHTPTKDERLHVIMADKRSKRIKARLILVAVVAGVLAVAGIVAWWLAPWLLALAGAGALAGLVWAGKPVDATLLSPRIRQHVTPTLTCSLVARALAEVVDSKTAKEIRAHSERLWQSGFVPIRGGHRIRVVLPGAAVADDLIPHEQRIATALGRPEDCAVVEPLPKITPGHFELYVFDKPMLGGAATPGPLASAKRTNWWGMVELGMTRTGRPHRERIHGGAFFVGGKPESGKSSTGLIIAAHTALDPGADLIIVNLKSGADYSWAKPICREYISTTPERDPKVVEKVTALTRWLLEEAGRRGDFFADLVEQGKATGTAVTEELSRRYRQLRPLTVIFDEIHRMFDQGDNPDFKAYADLLGKVLKAVRFVGITVIGITQLAGGESIPGVVTRASRVRVCLRVSEAVSFRQIFGDAGQGVFSSLGIARFPRGTALFSAEDGSPVKVQCHYLTPALPGIGERAKALREQARTLPADSERPTLDTTDPTTLLGHILDAIPTTAPTGGPGDAEVAWLGELETTLARHPDYTGRAPGWLSGELRSRAVPTGQLNRRDATRASGQRNEVGVRAGDVRAVLDKLITG